MHTIGRARAYLLLLLAILIQVTFLNRFTIAGSRPDLVLILVTFYGFFLGGGAGLESGIVAGFLTDLFALDYFGINMLVYGSTGLVAGMLRTNFSDESKKTQALLVFCCSAFSMCIHYAIAASFSGGLAFGLFEYLRSCVVPAGIYTAIVSVPVFTRLTSAYHLREPGEYW